MLAIGGGSRSTGITSSAVISTPGLRGNRFTSPATRGPREPESVAVTSVSTSANRSLCWHRSAGVSVVVYGPSVVVVIDHEVCSVSRLVTSTVVLVFHSER